MFIRSEFDNFLKEETEHEKIEECKKRKNECYGCCMKSPVHMKSCLTTWRSGNLIL